MSYGRLFLAVLLSLWLPLQGVAAIVMPFCKHSLVGEQSAYHPDHGEQMDHEHSGHAHPGTADSENGDHSSGPLLSSCDDCGQCHLSAAFTLPSPAFPEAAMISFPLPPFHVVAPRGVVSDQLHPPPLLTLI